MKIMNGNDSVSYKWLLVLPLICILGIAAFPSGVLASWRTETLDITKSFTNGYQRSIAVETTTNYPHMVYGGDQLYHAYYDGSQWQHETVDTTEGAGSFASIAIDSNNKVHISYYGGGLRYATNVSGSWVVSLIDNNGYSLPTSITTDSNNKVHISYNIPTYWYDEDSDTWWYGGPRLRHATNESGSWVFSVIDFHTGYSSSGSNSIAVDAANHVHVSYYDADNKELRYGTNASGSWVTSSVDNSGEMGDFSSIAVDSGGKVHISYHDNTNGLVRYATNKAGSWSVAFIDTVGSYDYGGNTSIALSSNDSVYIAYLGSGLSVSYATNDSGTWLTSSVDSVYWQGSAKPNISLAMDGADNMHFSYFDEWYDSLKYASNTSGAWVSEEIDSDAQVYSSSISTAVDANNKVHISYVSGGLKYATNTSGSWTVTSIDDGGDDVVRGCTSIAVDSNGKVHIGYCVLRNHWSGQLKYATNVSGSWDLSEVYSIPLSTHRSVSYVSLALDSSDKVHMSFYNDDNLMYASNASGSWIASGVDTWGLDAGRYSSIAVDSNNKVHISHYEKYNHLLRYSTNVSGSWVSTTLDYIGSSSGYTSIGLDSNDGVHISYFNSTGSDIYHMTNESGFWIKSVVASGQQSALVIDSNDNVHIKHNYNTSSNISGSWVTARVGFGVGGGDRFLAIDSFNTMHTGYAEGGNLVYATNDPHSVIAAGHEHTLYIKPDGSLLAWGHNDQGQLGDGTGADSLSPVSVGSDTDWKAVSAGWKHSLAIKKDGTLWAWGDNEYGQVGDGSTNDRMIPVQVGTSSDWMAISAGGAHNLALNLKGELWAWGYNYFGQVGDGSTTVRTSPVRIGSSTFWTAVSAGWEHSTALKADKTLYTWGWNDQGQLGDGSTVNSFLPVQIGLNEWLQVSAGWKHTVGLKEYDSLWAWGDNDYGQVGDGTTTDRHSPVQISGINGVSVIEAGGAHTQVLTYDGELWSWGLNSNGQLGDGTTATRYSPVQVGAGSGWNFAVSGWEHSVAVKDDGSLWLWGWNAFGQLGTGTTDDSYVPVLISVPTADFMASPLSGSVPLTVNFTNYSTGLDQPLSYEWDFDNDGSIDSTSENPSHMYSEPGTYTVKLTVTDFTGDVSNLTRTGYITVCGQVKIEGDSYHYPMLQDAYDAAADGAVIRSRGTLFAQDLSFNQGKTVIIRGGYGCALDVVVGNTTVQGDLSLASGQVVLENIIVAE